MKTNIILAGVGGQGILSIAAVIGYSAINREIYIKQAEVHGMSQRGGAVQSTLRISDKELYSDLIPKGKADLIISVEPMEGLRYLPWLKEDGWLITNSKPFVNIPNYPDLDSLLEAIRLIPNHILIDAAGLASKIKSARSSNMVVLGAAIPFLPFDWDDYVFGINQLFGKKGENVVNINLEALKTGEEYSLKQKK